MPHTAADPGQVALKALGFGYWLRQRRFPRTLRQVGRGALNKLKVITAIRSPANDLNAITFELYATNLNGSSR